MRQGFASIVVLMAFFAMPRLADAATRYVNGNNPSPAAPYNNWAKAANTIQDAVDEANPGDEVIVTNGVYASGGRVVYGTVTNRVAVTKPLMLRSVNGPEATAIVGYQVPGSIYGPGAVRGVYLTNGAVLSGFTITNGATRWGGEEPPEEDIRGGGVWCESATAIVSNCVVINNRGGNEGGGVYRGTLYDSTIRANGTRFNGGGVYAGELHRCLIADNVASYFGYGDGGGVYDSDLHGCVLTGNTADNFGGGARGGTLINCTLTLNTALAGGGAYDASLTNCLIYFNTAVSDPNYVGTNLSFCCTTPLPVGGTSNFTNPPALADPWHLSAGSPCRTAGTGSVVSGADIDRQVWLNPPSVGADEFYAGATGPLSVSVSANWTNVAVGVAVQLTSQIDGHAESNLWSFGDGTTAANQIMVSHPWTSPGDYPVTLTVFNTSFPGGVSATVIVHVDATPRYVALNNPAPAWPHNSWATAATNIQDAVDAAPVGGLVLVTNGVYATGGRAVDYYATMTNRVAVTVPLTLQSVNGPAVTSIQGHQIPVAINGSSAVRCIYLCDGARLNGFTLTNGATLSAGFSPPIVFGGGALCQSAAAVISNCVFAGNSCIDSGAGVALGTIYNSTFLSNSAYQGGAVSDATLFGCTLSGNRASDGGGAARSTLTDCLITNNASLGMYNRGGGVYYCALTNCQLLANTSQDYAGGAHASTLVNCVIAGNTAPYQGGGALNSTLFNCLVRGNSCSQFGGGLYGSTAYNSTVVLNNAGFQGGGTHSSTLYNSIVYDNSAGAAATSNYQGGTFYFSCTSPLVGTNNIVGPPDFVSAPTGDFRLQPDSPCINAGNNTYAPGPTDLAGGPRILDGVVDMGTYEFTPPPPPSPSAPFAFTGQATEIHPTQTRVNGFATPNGTNTTAWFEWGPRGGFTSTTTPVNWAATFGVRHQSQALSNLFPQSAYQYRLVASNSFGVVTGATRFFSTGSRVTVWGYNTYGQLNLPTGLTNAVAIAAGNTHSLTLDANGNLATWGHYFVNSPSNIPPDLTNVATITAGNQQSLALLADRTVSAWGKYYNIIETLPVSVPTGLTNVVALSAYDHTIALREDGTIAIWGADRLGQTNVPAGLSNIVAVAAGRAGSLALHANGTVTAWGNYYRIFDLVPLTVPAGLSNVVDIEFSQNTALAIRADGTVVAWGFGATNVPANATNIATLASHDGLILGLKRDGTMIYWGNTDSGQSNVVSQFSDAVGVVCGDGGHSLALGNMPPKVQPQTLGASYNSDRTVILTASDLNLDSLQFRITALPALGTLYQYNNGARGPAIVSANTIATDPGNRVLFAPATGDTGTPYTSFQFTAHDGLVASAPAAITLNVIAAAPFAHTLPVQQIRTNSAKLNGMATPNGLASLAWFEWGNSNVFDQATPPQSIGNGLDVVHVGADITGLTPRQTARCRLVVSNQAGIVHGMLQQFLPGGRVRAWGWNGYLQTNVPPTLPAAVISSVSAGTYSSLAVDVRGNITPWGGLTVAATNVPPGLSNVAAALVGWNHSMAILTNGNVVAWGQNDYGQTNVPSDLGNVVSVAAEYQYSAALQADGRVRIWGDYNPANSNIITSLSNVVAMTFGFGGFFLLADGTVRAVGEHPDPQYQMPSGLSNIVALASHGGTLALRRDGTVVSWGGAAPVPAGLTNVIAIDLGLSHCLALREDGTLVLWGNIANGGVDISTQLTNVAAISSGYGHNLALLVNASPVANPLTIKTPPADQIIIQLPASDPENDALQLRIQSLPLAGSLYQYTNGTPTVLVTNSALVTDTQHRVIFVPATNDIADPYASFTYTASDGELETAPAIVTISIIAPIGVFTRHATDIHLTSAKLNGFVAPNGFATTAWFEWGTNTSYGLTTTPLDAGSGNGVVHVSQLITGLSAGQTVHFRLVSSNASQTVTGTVQQFITGGKVLAWGDDSTGQPAPPTNLGSVVAVSGGLSHSLALRADGTVKGWGNNFYGQGSAPASLANVMTVAAGGFHNVALLASGTAFAWGRNNFNQTNVPAGATNGVAVAAGGQHSVLLRADGSLIAWGDNSQGQRTVPASLTNAVGIAAGWYHNVALRGDGTVTAWGANTYGQTNVPAGLTNVVWVGAGLYHSLALRGDGSLVAWGLNSSGQTNIPVTMTNLISVAAGGSHNLGLRADDYFTGWGNNAAGQARTPTSVSNVVNFAAGGSHSLALMRADYVPPTPPVFDAGASVWIPGGGFQLQFTGTEGASYRVWASTNLMDWELLGMATATAPGWFQFEDAAATNWPQRFYRATAP